MKCPKCGYLGFERADRCRNCGYDFSLASSPRPSPDIETPIKREAAPLPDLPLFVHDLTDDTPLITKPSAPRTPLAVRRATPEVPRMRATPPAHTPSLDPPRTPALDLPRDARDTRTPTVIQPPPAPLPIPVAARPPSSDGLEPRTAVLSAIAIEDAPLGARLLAVMIDVLLLLFIDVVVLYFTLQICGIGLADFGVLPRVPLLAFFLVQNGGYLAVFTAGGQTLGKMVTGIKVISAEPHEPLNFGSACLRELLWLVLAAPAGLGLVSVLAGDHRGLHDRFAGTRVVRASL